LTGGPHVRRPLRFSWQQSLTPSVGVAVGVEVNVPVFVGVAVSVGVFVGGNVAVGVSVGVIVAVIVGVGVGVNRTQTPFPSHTASKTITAPSPHRPLNDGPQVVPKGLKYWQQSFGPGVFVGVPV